jgi:hypothetical protein
MALTVRGASAWLRWGYAQAATLRAWTVTREADAWTLSAAVVTTDAFRLSQQPLVFVAPHQGGSWRWPVESLQITDGTLVARLGPKES